MVTAVPKKDFNVTVRFGYGLNTRASEDEIDPREASDGQNFLLDLENREFRNRPPFDLVATAPNGASVDGMAQLVKADGTISTLFQGGTTVYHWDGASFTSVGTVASGAKLRGPLSSNWQLSDKVIITDLALAQPLSEWDGATFKTVSHDLGGNFFAKYAFVQNERAFYGNVVSNASATPHLIAGSKTSDYTSLSLANIPSGSLSAGDPFFLLTPDLKPVNALLSAFGTTLISSQNKGRIFQLNGTDATNFAIAELYPNSCASGDEAMMFAGNDVMYGRQGRIESVLATQDFGDVETADLSRMVGDRILSFDKWTVVFNSRLQRVYFFPTDQQELWVLFKPLLDQERAFASARALQGQAPKSPWSKWVTDHALGFEPTSVMSMYDPIDGLEYVFMGDGSGNIYRLEGTGLNGDGGTAAIITSRTSATFPVLLDAKAFGVSGWIKYRRNQAFTAMISLLWAGEVVLNEEVTFNAPAISNRPVYGGGLHYGDGAFYGTAFENRFVREPLGISGQGNEFQVKVEIQGTTDFSISEVGLRFEAAS